MDRQYTLLNQQHLGGQKRNIMLTKDKNAAHPLGWVDLKSGISGYRKVIKSVPKMKWLLSRRNIRKTLKQLLE